jgi:hypothetical protein
MRILSMCHHRRPGVYNRTGVHNRGHRCRYLKRDDPEQLERIKRQLKNLTITYLGWTQNCVCVHQGDGPELLEPRGTRRGGFRPEDIGCYWHPQLLD